MDMLKKARGKAMAAVKEVQKEVQGIIQTPSQQAAGYQNSSYQHAPYQQYGQQHPPQLQNFQTQYSVAPSQSFPQGHSQQQYSSPNQYPNANQYSQYGQISGVHQPPAVSQSSYNQSQTQYGAPVQPQQYSQQYNQQAHSTPSPQGLQYSTPQVPPPYSPPLSNQQSQNVQAFQSSAHGSQSQTPLSSPAIHQPIPAGQQYQQLVQPVSVQSQSQFQSPPPQQHHQNVTSPVQQFNQNHLVSSPQSQQSAYSSPALSQQSQNTPLEQNTQQTGYFPSVAGQPNYGSQPVPHQNSMSPVQPTNYQYGSPPPIPQGRPQTTSPVTVNQTSHFQMAHPQQAHPPSQGTPPPVPPRQSVSSPAPAQYSQFTQPLQSPVQTPTAHYATQPVQAQMLPPKQASPVFLVSQTQQINRPPQAPVQTPPPSASSAPAPGPNLPGNRVNSPPSVQGNELQQTQQKPQSPAQTPLSQRPHVSHPPPEQNVQPPKATPSSPASTPAPLNFRPRPQSTVLPVEVVAASTAPPTTQYQAFAGNPKGANQTPMPSVAGSLANQAAPPRQSLSSPAATSTSTYQAFGVTSQKDQSPAALASRRQSNQIQSHAEEAQSPASPPKTQYQTFAGTGQSPQPNHVVPSGQRASSPSPPPTTQYQAFAGTSQSLQSSQSIPARQTAPSPSPPPITQYKAFVGTTQSPVQTYAAFKPSGSQETQVSPRKATPPQPYRPASTASQRPSRTSFSQSSHSPVQAAPQFTPPQAHKPSSAQISPQSQFTSPVQGHVSPQPAESTKSQQFGNVNYQNSTLSQTFELPSGPYDVSAPQGKPFVQPGPVEYADGLMLADEETLHVSVVRDAATRPAHVPLLATRKVRCSGFDPTLTDINQNFELRPEIVKQHTIPFNEGGPFAICEYCFHTFIEPHPWFASLFYPRPRAPRPTDKSVPQISFEKMIGCGLAFPRIRQVILGQTIPSRNIQSFIDYAKLDATLPPCSGEPQSGDYYGSQAIGSIALCKSCYECYIKNTAFDRHFSLMQMASPDHQWACDVGYSGYVHRTLLFDIAQNPPNFGHFAVQASKRLSMPPCTGHKQPIACSGPQGSTIFRSVKDNCGVFCSGCFHDKVVGTPAERAFGYEIEIDNDQKASLSCDLTFPFSNDGMIRAVAANKFDVWHAPIVAGNTTRLCPSIVGHDEAELMAPDSPTWYSFKDFPNIEVCARCYGMQIVQLQAEELFVPITRAQVPGRIRQCYMSPAKDPGAVSWDPLDYENTTAWRGQYLRNVINWCRDAGGDFTVAREAAANIAALPPPCGSELRKFTPPSGRKFFGHQASNPNDYNDASILMCEECFQYTAKGTPLEPLFSNDLTTLAYQLSPSGHRCSTWSIQTKRRLREACLTNTFSTYAQYHHQREAVSNKLWQSLRELQPLNELLKQHTANINRQTDLNIQMGGLKLAQQMNAQMNAAIMGIGGSVAEAAASDAGYRYGNSTAGMNYLTPNGANTAMAQHEASNMPGINLAMWEGASTERLTGEVQRRLVIQDELREQWKVLD